MQSVIHPDQSGFVKDSYTGENIRLISDVLEMSKIEKLSGILLSVDFRKAFDTLEWSCIHYALELSNFGDSLRNWVKVLYTEIESAVINNGFATNWFKPMSGVRQGCPLSPYLFILTAELMGYSRKNPHLPDGWHAGNSRGRGGSRALEIQVGGGV